MPPEPATAPIPVRLVGKNPAKRQEYAHETVTGTPDFDALPQIYAGDVSGYASNPKRALSLGNGSPFLSTPVVFCRLSAIPDTHFLAADFHHPAQSPFQGRFTADSVPVCNWQIFCYTFVTPSSDESRNRIVRQPSVLCG
jgi:hypothetical protein